MQIFWDFFVEAAMQKLECFRYKIKLTDGSNVLRLNRPYYVKAAVNASQTTKFMESILSKFVMVFKGEEGVGRAPPPNNNPFFRRDFFSHLFHRFENILIDNRAYMLEGEAGTSLSETMYAAGIFSVLRYCKKIFIIPPLSNSCKPVVEL